MAAMSAGSPRSSIGHVAAMGDPWSFRGSTRSGAFSVVVAGRLTRYLPSATLFSSWVRMAPSPDSIRLLRLTVM